MREKMEGPDLPTAEPTSLVGKRVDSGQNALMAERDTERWEKIESHLAHVERQVDELNGVIIEQGRLLERLKREVWRQSTAMQTLELERIKMNQQKPPHYQ